MTVDLVCVDDAFKDKTFRIELSDDGAVLYDPDGSTVGQYSLPDVAEKFTIPSKLECAPFFMIADGENRQRFKVKEEDVRHLRHFAYSAIAAQGPMALKPRKKFAWGALAFGAACIIIGGGFTLVSFLSAKNSRSGGTFWVFHGVIVVGICAIWASISQFVQIRAISRLAREQENVLTTPERRFTIPN